MNHHDAQILDDLLVDLDDLRHDARHLQDEAVAKRVHHLLNDFEDHLHGLLRRHRPRPEAPIVFESDGTEVAP